MSERFFSDEKVEALCKKIWDIFERFARGCLRVGRIGKWHIVGWIMSIFTWGGMYIILGYLRSGVPPEELLRRQGIGITYPIGNPNLLKYLLVATGVLWFPFLLVAFVCFFVAAFEVLIKE